MGALEDISESIIEGNEAKTGQLVQLALDNGIGSLEILNAGLMAGMNIVGERFKQADMFIPEVLLSARAMSSGTEILKPLLSSGELEDRGRIILGTVKGDVHEIGKNLVGVMLSGAGFDVIDIGTGVPPQNFIEAAVEKKAGLIAMSALLTTTMPSIKATVEELEK
ncbi:B12-binding domain-containing protein, partial [Chloroflexota bacterium]